MTLFTILLYYQCRQLLGGLTRYEFTNGVKKSTSIMYNVKSTLGTYWYLSFLNPSCVTLSRTKTRTD